MTAPPSSFGSSSRAPCRPLSSRTVKRSVIGGCGSLCLSSVSASDDEHGAAGAVVAAERRRAVGDDAVALAPRLGAGAERHGVEMGREQEARVRAGCRAGRRSGCRSRSAPGCACWRRRSGSRRPARRPSAAPSLTASAMLLLLAGDALDGEEAHEMLLRRSDIDQDPRGCSSCHRLQFVALPASVRGPREARASARPRRARSRAGTST